jgi:hypothetical protein
MSVRRYLHVRVGLNDPFSVTGTSLARACSRDTLFVSEPGNVPYSVSARGPPRTSPIAEYSLRRNVGRMKHHTILAADVVILIPSEMTSTHSDS